MRTSQHTPRSQTKKQTSSRLVSRVRTSQSLRRSVLRKKPNASTANVQDSGSTSLELLGKLDRNSSSWKTHQTLFDPAWEKSSEIYPTSGIVYAGILFQHKKSVYHTYAVGGTPLLPTPTASDSMRYRFSVESLKKSFIKRKAKRSPGWRANLADYLAHPFGAKITASFVRWIMNIPQRKINTT